MNISLGRHLILSLTLSSLLFSCSSMKNHNGNKGEIISGTEEPAWVYSPNDGCSMNEMCASAQGSSIEIADSNARKSLASIFETEIKAEFQSNTTSTQDGMDPSTSEYIQTTFNKVNESVEQALKGVEIKSRYEKDGNFFSLAYLNKNKAAGILREEVRGIDKKLSQLYKLKKRSVYKKMKTLFDVRSDLAAKFYFLMEQRIATPVGLDQINEIKYGQAAVVRKIKVDFDQGSNILAKNITKLLTQVGHKVVKTGFDVKIKLSLERTPEFFKVKGFIKDTYTLAVTSFNDQNQKIGAIGSSETVVGRSKAATMEKARNKFLNLITEDLEQLNID